MKGRHPATARDKVPGLRPNWALGQGVSARAGFGWWLFFGTGIFYKDELLLASEEGPDRTTVPSETSTSSFVGVTVAGCQGIVDTAAQEGLIGRASLLRLLEELRKYGLKGHWSGKESEARGIGGRANTIGVCEVPVALAGVPGILELTVVAEEVPLLIPVNLLHALKASVDLGNSCLYLPEVQASCPIEFLPSGHPTVCVTDFGQGWHLPEVCQSFRADSMYRTEPRARSVNFDSRSSGSSTAWLASGGGRPNASKPLCGQFATALAHAEIGGPLWTSFIVCCSGRTGRRWSRLGFRFPNFELGPVHGGLQRSGGSYYEACRHGQGQRLQEVPRGAESRGHCLLRSSLKEGCLDVTGSLIGMRWVLTFKAAEPDAEGNDQVKAKARIVVLGYSAPSLLEEPTTSPTMSRLTRQLLLNMASAMKWPIGSGDVKTAFLQARPEERSQRLLAKPLPELAEALGLGPNEAVELTGSAYGLAQAPREWFLDIQKTLKKLGARASRTDPCLWRVFDANGKICGLIGSYVDDFLFTGNPNSPTWIRFLKSFEEAYTWSPWEWGSFDFCGLRLTQHGDCSITVDHSAFCRDLTQMPDVKGPSRTMTDGELSQARAVLGSVQWRVTQSGPQHAAKLGHLQSLLSTKDTACISQINKLVREVQSARHLGTHVQNLGDCSAEDLIFVGWSDASLANRPDLSSTGGFLIGLMTPTDVLAGQGKVNLVSWRSQKLPRVARSSLAAESQALSLAEQEMMWCRLTWREMLGDDINLASPAEFTSKTKAYLIIDARGVYDALLKGADFSSGFNLRDKYSALDLMGVSDQLKAQGTLLEWCDSDHQLADGLTKSSKQDSLRKFLTQGTWRLRLPGAFMSARRRRALENEQATVTS
ncbi:RE1 [Symbiodinium sp. CCMP2592]|nr:RE1 [Symbiodinium sp. CCMP2592]